MSTMWALTSPSGTKHEVDASLLTTKQVRTIEAALSSGEWAKVEEILTLVAADRAVDEDEFANALEEALDEAPEADDDKNSLFDDDRDSLFDEEDSVLLCSAPDQPTADVPAEKTVAGPRKLALPTKRSPSSPTSPRVLCSAPSPEAAAATTENVVGPSRRQASPTPALPALPAKPAVLPSAPAQQQSAAPTQIDVASPPKRGRGRPKKVEGEAPKPAPEITYRCRFDCQAKNGGDLLLSSKELLRTHMKTQHRLVRKAEDLEGCICDGCKKIFPTKVARTKHHFTCFEDGRPQPAAWSVAYPYNRQERADTWAYIEDGTPSQNVVRRRDESGKYVPFDLTAPALSDTSDNEPATTSMHRKDSGAPTPAISAKAAGKKRKVDDNNNVDERPAKYAKQAELIDLTGDDEPVLPPPQRLQQAPARIAAPQAPAMLWGQPPMPTFPAPAPRTPLPQQYYAVPTVAPPAPMPYWGQAPRLPQQHFPVQMAAPAAPQWGLGWGMHLNPPLVMEDGTMWREGLYGVMVQVWE